MSSRAPESSAPPPRRRKSLLIRAGLTVVLLAIVAWSIDFSDTELAFAPDAGWWLSAGLAWVLVARVLLVLRWQLILRVLECRVSSLRLGYMVFASQAMGLIAPGSIGMDVARGALLRVDGKDDGASGTAVISSIVLDRAAATLGTALVGLAAALVLGEWSIAGLIGGITLLGGIGTCLLVSSNGWARGVLERILPVQVARRVLPKIENLLRLISTPGMVIRGLAPAIVLGMLVTTARAMLFLSLYHALGASVPVWLSILVLSMTLILMMAPVTLGGFGVRELALSVGFESIGVPAGVSVSVGVLAFVVQTGMSVPFAIWAMFAVGRNRPSDAPEESESLGDRGAKSTKQ